MGSEEKDIGKLSVINHIPATCLRRWLFQGFLFGFLGWWLETVWLPGLVTADNRLASRTGCCRLWARVVFLYIIWPLSGCYIHSQWKGSLAVSSLGLRVSEHHSLNLLLPYEQAWGSPLLVKKPHGGKPSCPNQGHHRAANWPTDSQLWELHPQLGDLCAQHTAKCRYMSKAETRTDTLSLRLMNTNNGLLF